MLPMACAKSSIQHSMLLLSRATLHCEGKRHRRAELADSSTLCTAYAQSDCKGSTAAAAAAAARQLSDSGSTRHCTGGNTQNSRRKQPCTVKQKWRRHSEAGRLLHPLHCIRPVGLQGGSSSSSMAASKFRLDKAVHRQHPNI
jgi:hypothetical protein